MGSGKTHWGRLLAAERHVPFFDLDNVIVNTEGKPIADIFAQDGEEYFRYKEKEILEELVRLRRRIEPQLVLLPALSDIHQDHSVIAREGLRAFKHATILGYELPMNTITFQHACFVRLEPHHLERKIAHVQCYRSQQDRPYMREEFIHALATVRGLQMNVPAAEAFEVIRLCVT